MPTALSSHSASLTLQVEILLRSTVLAAPGQNSNTSTTKIGAVKIKRLCQLNLIRLVNGLQSNPHSPNQRVPDQSFVPYFNN